MDVQVLSEAYSVCFYVITFESLSTVEQVPLVRVYAPDVEAPVARVWMMLQCDASKADQRSMGHFQAVLPFSRLRLLPCVDAHAGGTGRWFMLLPQRPGDIPGDDGTRV